MRALIIACSAHVTPRTELGTVRPFTRSLSRPFFFLLPPLPSSSPVFFFFIAFRAKLLLRFLSHTVYCILVHSFLLFPFCQFFSRFSTSWLPFYSFLFHCIPFRFPYFPLLVLGLFLFLCTAFLSTSPYNRSHLLSSFSLTFFSFSSSISHFHSSSLSSSSYPFLLIFCIVSFSSSLVLFL